MKFWKVLRKIIILAISLPLLALGIILIPLPGPGLLISLAALLLLSTEVEQVKPWLERRQAQLKQLWQDYKTKQDEIKRKYK